MRRVAGFAICLVSLAACPKPAPAPPPPTPATAPLSGAPATIEPEDVIIGDKRLEFRSGVSLQFKTASDELLPISDRLLDEVAVVMKRDPELRLRVEGHTDNQGKEEANLDLSKRRAAAVKDALVSRGVDASRVESLGCGAKYPLTKNDTEEGRETNRRVEFVIMSGVVNPCRVYRRDRMPGGSK